MSLKLLILPGDKPGPTIFGAIRGIIEFFSKDIGYEVNEGVIGGASIDAYGVPITEATLEQARAATAILYGAVGGPTWKSVENERRPSVGPLTIRRELKLYANLRPAFVFDELVAASSLKKEVVSGLDLVVVRELIGGLYTSKPAGIEVGENGGRRGFNTLSYTTDEIRRIARVGFEVAERRSGRICSVEKATILKASQLWHEEVAALHAEEFPGIALTHTPVDTVAHDLVHDPRSFDVILCDNMFGDILSDAAAALTGIPSMLPSASLAEAGADGLRKGLYEQMHEAIALRGTNDTPNPLGTVLSLAMLFRYSFGAEAAASRLEGAVNSVLKDGLRTHGLPVARGNMLVPAAAICDAVLAKLTV